MLGCHYNEHWPHCWTINCGNWLCWVYWRRSQQNTGPFPGHHIVVHWISWWTFSYNFLFARNRLIRLIWSERILPTHFWLSKVQTRVSSWYLSHKVEVKVKPCMFPQKFPKGDVENAVRNMTSWRVLICWLVPFLPPPLLLTHTIWWLSWLHRARVINTFSKTQLQFLLISHLGICMCRSTRTMLDSGPTHRINYVMTAYLRGQNMSRASLW